MEIQNFNPYVRFFDKVRSNKDYRTELCAFDFRLFYIISGCVYFETDSKQYKLYAGDIITIPPAYAYKLSFKGLAAEYYIVNFDFAPDFDCKSARTPVAPKGFNKNEVFSFDCPPPFKKPAVFRQSEALSISFDTMLGLNLIEPYEQAFCSALLKTALCKIGFMSSKRGISENNDIVSQIEAFVKQNCSKNITNSDVAKHFSYHPFYINNLFSKTTGCSLHRYIVKTRLFAAKQLLSTSQKSVAEIAEACGFNDSSYFCAFFKKAAGMTPNQYRNLIK